MFRINYRQWTTKKLFQIETEYFFASQYTYTLLYRVFSKITFVHIFEELSKFALRTFQIWKKQKHDLSLMSESQVFSPFLFTSEIRGASQYCVLIIPLQILFLSYLRFFRSRFNLFPSPTLHFHPSLSWTDLQLDCYTGGGTVLQWLHAESSCSSFFAGPVWLFYRLVFGVFELETCWDSQKSEHWLACFVNRELGIRRIPHFRVLFRVRDIKIGCLPWFIRWQWIFIVKHCILWILTMFSNIESSVSIVSVLNY